MSAPLEIKNLHKNYGTLKAVNDVTFSIQPGEVFGLLGPNGAGKTSVISTIVTLTRPTSGTVRVFGYDVTKEPRMAKRQIGFVPQELVNHGYFDVEEILRFHSGYYGLWPNTERIHFLLKRLGLWEHKNKKVKQLSGGMKRRLLIAKALVHQPKLLLLDEPTAGVDIDLRNSLWEFVLELKKQGCSVLLTTHYIHEAEQLCDRVGIISGGVLRRVGETSGLIRDLTFRRVCMIFRDKAPKIDHPQLVEKTETELIFNLKQDSGLGALLHQIQHAQKDIVDIRIQEGRLEDALTSVLKEWK